MIAPDLIEDLKSVVKHEAQRRKVSSQIADKVVEIASKAANTTTSPSVAIRVSYKTATDIFDRLADLHRRADFEAKLKGENRKASRDIRNRASEAACLAVEEAILEDMSDDDALDRASLAATAVYEKKR